MKGSYKLNVSDKYNNYNIFLRRNITILRGDSGTGKTTLFDMINAYYNEDTKSGVKLSRKKGGYITKKRLARAIEKNR